VFSAEDGTNRRQAAETTLLEQLDLEVYLAARTRAAEHRPRRPSPSTEPVDGLRLSGCTAREHVGAVCYTRGPYVMRPSTNY
jgi:hypothetical protein